MKKWIILLAAVLLLVSSIPIYYLYMNSYIPFQPVIVDNGDFAEDHNFNVDEENLKMVLNFYSITWKEKDGRIFIKRNETLNKELMYNYTIKANDVEYIKQVKNYLRQH